MDTVADLLGRHWGMRGAAVRPLGGGMNSETWLVAHGQATYVAKRVAAPALAPLAEGCVVASLLAGAGIVTGRPVPTLAGELVVADARLALLEHVPGHPLEGDAGEEQGWMAATLARVHAAGAPAAGPGTTGFFDWLSPEAEGVAAHPWLAPAILAVRAETDAVAATWAVLHTDPAPEAFVHDPVRGVTGLIDWAGSRRGPVLYDIASAVMYLGGPDEAAPFLDGYRVHGPVGDDELEQLDAYRRFRWAVQAAYFAGRLACRDLTGVAGQDDNRAGLDPARRGLAELGLAT